MGLERALEALAVTAGEPPVLPEGASLWSSLERRIAARPPGDGARPARVWEAVAAAGPLWTGLDDERPLRSAWMRDTFREMVEAAGLGGSDRPEGTRRRGTTWRTVGAGLAASVLVSLIVLPTTWRRQRAAEAVMIANAAPAAGPDGPPAPLADRAEADDDPAPDEEESPPAGQLAQADPKAGDKPEPPVRYGYDLDHGTPMPPDGRDAKSVY
jgi:hypothetical protein